MSDGAGMGIGPERALETVLGEPQPAEQERMSVEEMERQIRRASLKPADYNGCGLAVARIVLEYLEQHPEDIGLPPKNVYDFDRLRAEKPDFTIEDMKAHQLAEGLYDRIKSKDAERSQQLSDLGMTGFLWGWGYNAAHRVLGLEQHPNPAIITIGGDEQ